MIPITVVRTGPEEEELVLQVLRSGMLAQGPMVERFEHCCREMTGAAHAVAVNNGTTALVLALEALQLQPGDEVVTSPFTFAATLNAIIEAGAIAKFGDIGDDFNLDPASVEAVLTPRTKVLMPVHLYGQAADMPALATIADRAGAVIVEDAAQSHGATIDGRPVGGYGLATFSFYATKNLQSGEGGVVTTNDDGWADRMRVLRNQGMRVRYQYDMPGHNYRLTDLAAAVALPQFARIAAIVEARRANAAYYNAHLADVPGLVTPYAVAGRGHVWHQYTLRLTDEAALGRDELLQALTERGIGSGIYYPRAVYDYECYRDHPQVVIGGEGRRADEIGGRVVSIPVHQYLTPADRDEVVSTVRELLGC